MNKRFAPLPAELVDKWRGETRRTRDVFARKRGTFRANSGDLFSDEETLCVRLSEKLSCTVISLVIEGFELFGAGAHAIHHERFLRTHEQHGARLLEPFDECNVIVVNTLQVRERYPQARVVFIDEFRDA